MPLSGAGLWEAEIMTPKSAPRSPTRKAAAGVGRTPASQTSTPEEASPASTAALMNWPLMRGSRATTATGRRPAANASAPRTGAAAWASWTDNSTVRVSLARPRTPSVPNNLDMISQCRGHLCGLHHGRVTKRAGGR